MNIRLRIALIIAVSVALMSPTIFQGFIIDDPMILSIIEENYPERPNSFDAFSVLFNQWELFWWNKPDIQLKFFRPAGSALMRLDYALFGRWAPGWHLHSLLWQVFFLLALWVFYRRLDPRLGWWALLLVALDESFALTAGFLSNRHALVAMTFCVLAIWAYLRWREENWRPGWVLACLGIVLALLTAETGLVVFAYLGAYELFAGKGDLQRRGLALLMPLTICLIYVAWYRGMGYGFHSGSSEVVMYLDPGADPLLFMKEASKRVPALLAGGILGVPPDIWIQPESRIFLISFGIIGVVLLLGTLKAGWGSVPEIWRQNLKWLVPGALVSCIPLVGTFPSHRQMAGPLLGLAPALVLLLFLVFKVWWPAGGWRRWTSGVLGAVLILIHFVVAPFIQVLVPWRLHSMREGLDRNLSSVPHWNPSEGVEDVLVLQSPDGMTMFYGPVLLDEMHGTRRGHWTALSAAPFSHRWTRTGPRELELDLLEGEMLTTFPENHWPLVEGLVPGKTLEFRGIRIRIIEVGEKGPKRVAFEIPRPLDDPKLLLLVWVDRHFEQFTPPPLGESVVLPWTRGFSPFP